MIKRISTKQLKPGMFIDDMNCGWLRHPFLTNKITIIDDEMIERIMKHGIREVYIDTNKGITIEDAPTREDVARGIQAEMNKMAETEPDTAPVVPIKEELKKAREIKKEAKKTIHDIMDDVRFGKQIEKAKVDNVVTKMVTSIFRNQDALLSMGRLKKTDEYTYMHCMTVGILMIAFGKHLGLDKQVLHEIGIGAMMHDIGKTQIPQDLLVSKHPLNEDEYELMKQHVIYSRKLLEKTEGISELSVQIASQHHERIDGSGYPEGLKGDAISKFGRAAAIADVYDAMTSKRKYQPKFEPTEVLGKLFEWSEHYYDKQMVQQFIRCVGIYPVGTLVRLESGLLAVVLKHGEKSLLHPTVKVVYNAHKNRYIKPSIIDLSEDERYKIVSHEPSDIWGIEPELHLF
ncbi:MAG: HD-GYP domain-containing protein [Nitrospiraceae bacterium]|nr:MAG: HD-GYP domain-containing protein [Nitrospiraceae bacterium]